MDSSANRFEIEGPDGRHHLFGTATTIVRLGSFTVLTDPNFLHRGQRAYLGKDSGLGGLPNPQCSR
jgi:hypothetical protein